MSLARVSSSSFSPFVTHTFFHYFFECIRYSAAKHGSVRYTVFQPPADESSSAAATTTTSLASPRNAKYISATPERRRSYLVRHGEECSAAADDADKDSTELLEKYDLLSSDPTTAHLAVELWKYCSLYLTGGVYLDRHAKLLVGLEDVLHWTDDDDGGESRRNYAVATSSRSAGVEPLWNAGDIARAVVKSASFEGVHWDVVDGGDAEGERGRPVVTAPLLAISTPKNEVPRKMIRLLLSTSVKRLEEEALLLPKALMRFVMEEETRKDWTFFTQRCHGVVVAGGDEER